MLSLPVASTMFFVALQPIHLVLLEQEFHTLDVGADDIGLACLHAGEVELDLVDQNAVLGKA
jgi:hypothetical protein